MSRATDLPEYDIWAGIIQRCENPNNKRYKDWGGRGIKMCKRWRDSFSNFYEDMGPKPTSLHTIDRINNDGDYEPANCRWATRKEQNSNYSRNQWVEYKGQRQTIDQWSQELGIKYRTLHARLIDYRWPIEKSLTQPVRKVLT